DLLYQNVKSAGVASGVGTQVPTGIQLGSGVRPVAVQKLFIQGDFQQTQSELDIAVEGDGFFQITKPDGEISYTRAGSFKKDSEGRMVSSDGYPLEPSISIPSNASKVSISSDGIVSAEVSGSSVPTDLGRIELARFVNPSGLNSIGKNLFLPTASSGDPITGRPGQEGFGTLSQGYLESSNVNIAEEMINMIIGQRSYEINSKSIQTADEVLQTANNLRR
ncbi:MAG TPA: flagellar basal-body rod protein FlgG, partial [Nitrospiria bacterium]|nr:flagellar basal-body rod protein FlgG [Nitrospiria bacterium]